MLQYGLADGVLWQIIPQIITYCLQDFLQLVDGIWHGLKCLYMKVEGRQFEHTLK